MSLHWRGVMVEHIQNAGSVDLSIAGARTLVGWSFNHRGVPVISLMKTIVDCHRHYLGA